MYLSSSKFLDVMENHYENNNNIYIIGDNNSKYCIILLLSPLGDPKINIIYIKKEESNKINCPSN